MGELRLKFRGIDNFNRPVFVEEGTRNHYGDTNHLFDYNSSKEYVIGFYERRGLSFNRCLTYFGGHFNCEPMGTPLNDDVNIIIVD